MMQHKTGTHTVYNEPQYLALWMINAPVPRLIFHFLSLLFAAAVGLSEVFQQCS